MVYLLGDLHWFCLEICIVTPTIYGCIYINPYFKFQTHNTDRESPDLNPRFIFFQNKNELISYIDEILKLR
jgi:hypothetical protein